MCVCMCVCGCACMHVSTYFDLNPLKGMSQRPRGQRNCKSGSHDLAQLQRDAVSMGIWCLLCYESESCREEITRPNANIDIKYAICGMYFAPSSDIVCDVLQTLHWHDQKTDITLIYRVVILVHKNVPTRAQHCPTWSYAWGLYLTCSNWRITQVI